MNIVLNGIEYSPVNKLSEDIRIVILQRGWVMVGFYERDGDNCKLHKACVIRKWGTSQGLGELFDGPTTETILDKCNGEVEFHRITEIATIKVNFSKWSEVLK